MYLSNHIHFSSQRSRSYVFTLTEWMTFLPPKKNFKWMVNVFQGEKNRHIHTHTHKGYFYEALTIHWDLVKFWAFKGSVLSSIEVLIFYINLVFHSVVPGWRSFHPYAENWWLFSQWVKLILIGVLYCILIVSHI